MYNPVFLLLKACTGIQNPLMNWNLVGLGNHLSGKYMSQGSEVRGEDVEVKEQFGVWVGGKTTGKLKLDKENLMVRVSKTIQKLPLSQFKSLEEAEIYGKSLLYRMCKESGSLLNEYRYVQQDSETFIEVKIGKFVIQVDEQFRGLIENHLWEYNAVDKSIYRKEGKIKARLEEEMFGIQDAKLKFTKLDGNIYNFRIKNIRPAEPFN